MRRNALERTKDGREQVSQTHKADKREQQPDSLPRHRDRQDAVDGVVPRGIRHDKNERKKTHIKRNVLARLEPPPQKRTQRPEEETEYSAENETEE